MPEIFAPTKMTITTLDGHGVTLKAGETRDVNPSVFAAAIQQGAFPINPRAAAMSAAVPQEAPIEKTEQTGELDFAPIGIEGSTLVGEDDADAPEPAAPTIAAAAPIPGDAELIAALHRIARRNDAKEFNQTGIPKASVVSRELGGHPVDAETREKAWAQVAKELGE